MSEYDDADPAIIEWRHQRAVCPQAGHVGDPLLCPSFPTPHDRVNYVDAVLDACWGQPDNDRERVTDLLADVLHFCDQSGFSFDVALTHARLHHARESGRDKGTP